MNDQMSISGSVKWLRIACGLLIVTTVLAFMSGLYIAAQAKPNSDQARFALKNGGNWTVEIPAPGNDFKYALVGQSADGQRTEIGIIKPGPGDLAILQIGGHSLWDQVLADAYLSAYEIDHLPDHHTPNDYWVMTFDLTYTNAGVGGIDGPVYYMMRRGDNKKVMLLYLADSEGWRDNQLPLVQIQGEGEQYPHTIWLERR